MPFFDDLREQFSDRAKKHEPLAKHVNFRLGGPATYFVEARTSDEIVVAVQIARQYGVRYFILGGGTNTLFADGGYDGLVIKAANRSMRIEGNRVIAEAGVISALVARKTAEAGLAGFTWAISLPGTIGGAVRGNAGCFGGEMKDSVLSVRMLRGDEVVALTNAEMHFAYRHSVLKEVGNDDVILDVTLELPTGNREELLKMIDDTLASRKATQPLYAASAGCMFKNVEFDDADDVRRLVDAFDVPADFVRNRRIPTGWIVEKLGLKGLQIGEAAVSKEHGNFLLNMGGATANDIITLIADVRRRVHESTGITLEEEVKVVM